MLNFKPTDLLTLTAAPVGCAETIFTYWVCPDHLRILDSFMGVQIGQDNPVGAMTSAQDVAIEPFKKMLELIQRNMNRGAFKASNVWVGDAMRDQKQWDNPAIWYPIHVQTHSHDPEFLASAITTPLPCDPSPLMSESDIAIVQKVGAVNAFGQAVARLKEGDFSAWGLYELRHQTADGQGQWKDFLPMPHWDGELRPGMRLLVHAEQGYGDCIQFARYLPWLNDMRADFLCYPCLIPLMKTLNFKGKIFSELPLGVAQQYDYHVPLCSLPLALDPTMSELPRAPYLRSDRDKYWLWRDRIGREGFRAGICWAGQATHQANLTRTRTLEQLVAACPKGAMLFSLQKGEAAKQLNFLPRGVRVIDFTEDLHDWSDTAAMLDNLDLVVSVDTAVAHLAGALGRPVKLLVGPNAEWRWEQGHDRTRWYSSMVLDRS